MAKLVSNYTNEQAIRYLEELLLEIKEHKIEVHSADRVVSNNSIACLPTGSVTLDFIVLP